MKIQHRLFRLLLALFSCFWFADGSVIAAGATKNSASAVSLPRKTPLYANWRLVAQSDIIVRGKLRVPIASLRAAVKENKREVIPLHLDVTRVLKGKSARRTLEIQIFSAADSDDVSPPKVLSLHGKDVTAFLAEDEDPSCKDLYFAGHTPNALLFSSRWPTQHIPDEVANQKRIAAHFARPGAFAATPVDGKVKRLIADMLKENTQFQSFADLEELGDVAVPATIRWMDDRRPLAVPRIVEPNQSFEGSRHYGPGSIVLDALDAILKQVTGESIGSLNLFSSEAHRQQTVNAWRTYLYYGRPQNRTSTG